MSLLHVFKALSEGYVRRIQKPPLRPRPETWSDEAVTASWLGHSTVLMNVLGLNIITDPVLYARVGIGIGPMVLGPKRYVAPALRAGELPRIDVVLLSHAHMDHMDLRTLGKLNPEAVYVTAQHTADVFAGLKRPNVEEVAWNEVLQVQTPRGELSVAAYKLRHWGARVRTDDHRKYNAYVLERGGVRICFAGDTAYTDAGHLGSRGPNDLFIAPIGAYDPWIHSHCTPEEAVRMADAARARYVMPIHHQTFKLSAEPMDEPIARFQAALKDAPERAALTQIGETFVLP